MVLVVLPEFTAGPAERFEVHLRYAPAREHNITFVKFTRLSFYSKFESCRDDGVDVKLCACSEHRPLKPLNIKKLIKRESFKRETAVQVLDSQSCLFLATRKLDTKLLSGTQARVLAFEVANVCEHVEFTINVEGGVQIGADFPNRPVLSPPQTSQCSLPVQRLERLEVRQISASRNRREV